MAGRCYAVVFSNGHVKFGRTKLLGKRVSRHKHAAAAHAVDVSEVIFTSLIKDEKFAEKEILKMAMSVFERSSGETFVATSTADVVAVMRSIGADITRAMDVVLQNGRTVAIIDDNPECASADRFMFDQSLVAERISSVLADGPKTTGIIYNRIRGVPRRDVDAAIIAMVTSGEVVKNQRNHPKNKRIVSEYSLT